MIYFVLFLLCLVHPFPPGTKPDGKDMPQAIAADLTFAQLGPTHHWIATTEQGLEFLQKRGLPPSDDGSYYIDPGHGWRVRRWAIDAGLTVQEIDSYDGSPLRSEGP